MSRVEAAARALVGVRFRLHGRDAVHGLDCVGLVALATGRAAPTGYGWRSGDEGGWRRCSIAFSSAAVRCRARCC